VTKVKICGITNLDDAMAACEAGADAIGFVFAREAMARNRYIAPDEAQKICHALPPFVQKVAVCVNEPVDDMMRYLHFVNYVQLCGDETAIDCQFVSRRSIKVFHVGADFDPKAMLQYPTTAYLLDASVGNQRGGTGENCDWNAARCAVELGRPIILAGGLTPENVADAVAKVRPYAVDVSGGVESAPGKKDHERIRSFIRNVKRLSLP
jgi:phosphoribosylanthranilate isomerase